MAVSKIANAVGNVAADTSITPFDITIPGGKTNVAVAVFVTWYVETVSAASVTVGGVTATAVSGASAATGMARALTTMYVAVLGSASGAKSVVVSWTGASDAAAMAIAGDGVDQSTPCQNGTSGHDNGVASIAITGSADGVTVSGAGGFNGNTPSTPGETQTDASNVGNIGYGAMYATGEASPTHSWGGADSWWAMVGADFKAASATGSSPAYAYAQQ